MRYILHKRCRSIGHILLAVLLAAVNLTSLTAVTSASSGPAYVQSKDAYVGSGKSVSTALASATTAGNLLVVYVVWSNTGTASVSDNRGNTYTSAGLAKTTWGSNYSAQVFYAKNIKSGTPTIKATFSNSVSFGILYAHEYSGLDKTNPLDGSKAAQGTGTALDSGAVATTNANDLVFGGGASVGAVTSGGNGFTVRSLAEGNITEDKTVGSVGAYSATATHGGGGWVMQAVAFKGEAVAPDTAAPSVPTNLTATSASASTINLSWNPSTDNTAVAGYKIYRGSTQIATTASTNYQDPGLTPETTYSYTVSAYDAAGNESAQSASASATTAPLPPPDTEAPSVPTGLTATASSSTRVDLQWNTATDNVGVTGYRVSRDGNVVTTTAQTNFSDTGLTANTTYNYTVAALDAAGNVSADTAPVSVTTPQAPVGCALPNYPNASCTGVPASTTLTPYVASCAPPTALDSSCAVTAVDGTTCHSYRQSDHSASPMICDINTVGHVIDGMDIQACVYANVPSVVIRNSKINCSGSEGNKDVVYSGDGVYSGTGLLIEDSEVSCMAQDAQGNWTVPTNGTGIGDTNFTARRVNVHGCENGFDLDQYDVVQDSFIHDLYQASLAHTDGIQFAYHIENGQTLHYARNLTIDHNTIYAYTAGYSSDLADGTSAIISNKEASDENILIQNNLLAGGGYTLYCNQGRAGINYRVLNNHFSTIFHPNVGVSAPWTDCQDETQVSGNVYHETGLPVPF